MRFKDGMTTKAITMFPPVGLDEEDGVYQRRETRRERQLLGRESRLLDRRRALRLTWIDLDCWRGFGS
jgi:hypothetical protein